MILSRLRREQYKIINDQGMLPHHTTSGRQVGSDPLQLTILSNKHHVFDQVLCIFILHVFPFTCVISRSSYTSGVIMAFILTTFFSKGSVVSPGSCQHCQYLSLSGSFQVKGWGECVTILVEGICCCLADCRLPLSLPSERIFEQARTPEQTVQRLHRCLTRS